MKLSCSFTQYEGKELEIFHVIPLSTVKTSIKENMVISMFSWALLIY